jgi:hypothetical protein
MAAVTPVLKKFVPSQSLNSVIYSLILIGVIGFAVGLMKDQSRLWTSYLVAFFFFSSLGLGGLFFSAVNFVANAGWSSGIRRLSEGMSAFLPVMFFGSLILLLGVKKLYPWADPEVIAAVPLVQAKTAYLNIPFLIVRLVVFGLGSLYFAHKIVGNSLLQDSTGDAELTHKNRRTGIAFILFFAIFFSLFSVDLLMSLLPTWYSTIFGVYLFAGLFQSSLAFLMLLMIFIKNNQFVQGYYTVEHVHDVAKYLKAFTVFWAYIAFSQFMLIWYANIPEETEFFLMRAQNGWMAVSMALLIFKFVVPFLALLPRGAKRNEVHLTGVCLLILLTQYLDIFWLVYPNFNENNLVFGFQELTMIALFLGIFLLTTSRFLQKNNLVAIKDPRLHESLSHHVTY